MKLSNHAVTSHKNEKWNAITIFEAYKNQELYDVELITGKTANVLFGTTKDGEFVGLVLSATKINGEIIIITGFSAPKEYWITNK